MYIDIAQWTTIRRRLLRGGVSQRQMALEAGISRQTARKMLKFVLPPGHQRKQLVRPSKLGPCIGVIDQIVKQDRMRPEKQRTTAKRIWQRLCQDAQFTGGYTIVKDYARRARFIANADMKKGRQPQGEGPTEPSFESDDPAQITYTVLKSVSEREAVQMLPRLVLRS